MYCTRSDVEQIYGRGNVARWGDLDNTGDTDDIDSRVSYFIQKSSIDVDGELSQSPYSTPFAEPYPEIIVYLTALQAGIKLYNGRRIIDDERQDQTSAQDGEYRRIIDKINGGNYAIAGATRVSTKPIKVVENVDEEVNYGSEFSTPCRDNRF